MRSTGAQHLGSAEQSHCAQGSLDLRDTNRTIGMQAYSLCRIDVELVVVEKDNAVRGTGEVSKDMLKGSTRRFEMTDLMRQVVAV